jgi:hypothetical protein
VSAALLLPDGSTKSQLTPILGAESNTLKMQNALQRRAWLFAYLVEATDAAGNAVPYADSALNRSTRIPSTLKLEGIIGTLLSWLQGKVSLGPQESSLMALGVPKGYKKARYRLIAVGPGIGYGEGVSGLSPEEEKALRALQWETYLFDLVLPIVFTVLPDALGEGSLKQLTIVDYASLHFIQQITGYLEKKGLVKDKLESGDYKEALLEFFNTAIKSAELQGIMGRYLEQILSRSGRTIQRDLLATGLARMGSSVDLSGKIVTLINEIVVLVHLTTGRMAEQWDVLVTPATLRVTPRSAVITAQENLPIKASLREGAELYGGKVRFTWKANRPLGHLLGQGIWGYDITLDPPDPPGTPESHVAYYPDANVLKGVETVTVTAYDDQQSELDRVTVTVTLRDPKDNIFDAGLLRAQVSVDRTCAYWDEVQQKNVSCKTPDCVNCLKSPLLDPKVPGNWAPCGSFCNEDKTYSVYHPAAGCTNWNAPGLCLCFRYNNACMWSSILSTRSECFASEATGEKGYWLFWVTNRDPETLKNEMALYHDFRLIPKVQNPANPNLYICPCIAELGDPCAKQ